jgi:ribosomal protein S18 acetylase RimI-like enzyme
MRIRAVRPEEWEQLREIRLSALADAPDAFGDTHARAATDPEESWRAWIESGWGSGPQVTLVADDSGSWEGMAVGVLLSKDPDVTHLFAMWVAPSRRREGLGRALVEAVAEWGREGGATRLRLGVTTSNAAATALYRACGFHPTGDVERELRPGSELLCGIMERTIERAGGAGYNVPGPG